MKKTYPYKFPFHKSYVQHLRDLEPALFKEMMIAICDYAFEEVEPTFFGYAATLWSMIKRQIDKQITSDLNRRARGRIGGLKGQETHRAKREAESCSVV